MHQAFECRPVGVKVGVIGVLLCVSVMCSAVVKPLITKALKRLAIAGALASRALVACREVPWAPTPRSGYVMLKDASGRWRDPGARKSSWRPRLPSESSLLSRRTSGRTDFAGRQTSLRLLDFLAWMLFHGCAPMAIDGQA